MKMFAPVLIAFILLLCASPGSAFECTNAGAGGTAPDDTGDAGATACGRSAVAGGDDATAVGDAASAAGDFSSALGNAASSGGSRSTALGTQASSAGASSTSLGDSATSDGLSSIALGHAANSSAAFSTALGDGASTGGGASSTALGRDAFSDGDNSAALGAFASASGSSSTALGVGSSSVGQGSIALGQSASSGGNSSTALGRFASSGGFESTALGYRATAPNANTIVLGQIDGENAAIAYADVAIGTTNPLAPLHVFRDDGTAQVLVEETSMDAVPRTLFRLAGAGINTKFEIDNTMAGVNWAFTNSGDEFRISRQGSGVVEFSVDNDGNAVIAGDLDIGGTFVTNLMMPSDRTAKRDVEAVDTLEILDRVAALKVNQWRYRDRPEAIHIGPMAQDFHAAFGLGDDDTTISVVDASGVALVSIQALNEKLERENDVLKQRLAELEAVVMKLAAQSGDTVASR